MTTNTTALAVCVEEAARRAGWGAAFSTSKSAKVTCGRERQGVARLSP